MPYRHGVVPQVSHNTDAVVAGLSFLGQLDRIREMPVAAKSGGSGAASSSGAAPQPKPEPDMAGGRQPATLSERVKQAFAAHHLPIHNKNDVPFTTLKIACPGTCCCPGSRPMTSQRRLRQSCDKQSCWQPRQE